MIAKQELMALRGEWGLDVGQGARIVEPYSLRRTLDRNLLLFVVNDHGALRSYRVDRIAGVRPTDKPFKPRYVIEF